jgi:hypothetical protein
VVAAGSDRDLPNHPAAIGTLVNGSSRAIAGPQ